jgi:hypothetical protein
MELKQAYITETVLDDYNASLEILKATTNKISALATGL